MNTAFKRIAIKEAKSIIQTGDAQIIDIRDEQSFLLGHIDNAQHVDNYNVQQFIQQADFDKPLIVYCYHGNSSQPAAAFFCEQGFEEVYSLDGGYTEWQQQP